MAFDIFLIFKYQFFNNKLLMIISACVKIFSKFKDVRFFYLEHFNFKYLDFTHFFLVCSGWALRNSIVLNLFDTPPQPTMWKIVKL